MSGQTQFWFVPPEIQVSSCRCLFNQWWCVCVVVTVVERSGFIRFLFCLSKIVPNSMGEGQASGCMSEKIIRLGAARRNAFNPGGRFGIGISWRARTIWRQKKINVFQHMQWVNLPVMEKTAASLVIIHHHPRRLKTCYPSSIPTDTLFVLQSMYLDRSIDIVLFLIRAETL